ncbi:MAG TPA: tail fiber domain-containing protein [Steroidobacteraceae bacterium]|nr:tail fiber domain-containing protein [Steroidobacteraceae bacterium]
MPLDFPSSPSVGTVYDQWQWDGTKWIAIVGTLPAGPAGPTGPQGQPGISAGRILYYDATTNSDISGYKKLLLSPSPNIESTVAVACTGVNVDFPVEEFATDAGVPGAVDYPAGTAYRRIYAMVNSGTARLHLQVYVRSAAGVETLVRDEYSPQFTDQAVALQEWVTSVSSAGTLGSTDRIVNKISAQRITGGGGTVTVTCFFEGTTHASHIQTTILAVAGAVTNLAAGTGLTASPSPITGAGTMSLTVPVAIANGGTNATTAGAALTNLGAYPASNPSGYVTGGPYLPTAGGSMTGAIDMPNNVAAFRGKETGGTARNLAWMGSNNQIYVGDGNNSINLFSNGTVTLTSPIDLQNNNALRCKDTGGTLHQAVMLSSDNNFYVGDGSRNIIVNTGVSPNQLWATGGASKPGGGVWTDNSDARLKRNVVDYRPDDALAAVLQLRPVQFEFNGLAGTPDDGKTFVGLVADEVEPVMPEMVSTREAFLRADDAAPVDVKVLDCTALLFALVNAVKDLSAQISELQARLG